MGRNYSQPTLKILFGEAATCAHPDCSDSLIFRERGLATVVAQIAHIRSESPGGPRHDPGFNGDLNGPENLLLLCGRHHPPVDRHSTAYTVEELLAWKAKQREEAGGGTPLSESDVRYFAGLSDDEREALTTIARRAQRVADTCTRAQGVIDTIRAEEESARLQAFRQLGPVQEIDDDGNATPMSDKNFQLAPIERKQWKEQVQQAWERETPTVVEALGTLSEEIAVLKMMAGSLGAPAERVGETARSVIDVIGDGPQLEARVASLGAQVAELWQIATGETTDD